MDFHYVCFVKSQKDGHLYQLDGDLKGPVDLGPLPDGEGDLLEEGALRYIRKFIAREDGSNVNFGLMALAPSKK